MPAAERLTEARRAATTESSGERRAGSGTTGRGRGPSPHLGGGAARAGQSLLWTESLASGTTASRSPCLEELGKSDASALSGTGTGVTCVVPGSLRPRGPPLPHRCLACPHPPPVSVSAPRAEVGLELSPNTLSFLSPFFSLSPPSSLSFHLSITFPNADLSSVLAQAALRH